MLRYSGPGSPGGVALGLKMMQRAFASSGRTAGSSGERCRRHGLSGTGRGDACGLVTGGLTEGRYVVSSDPALERPERGDTLRTFAFWVSYRDRAVSLLLREGFVTDEFVRLAQSSDLAGEEQQHFAKMKQALAGHLLVTEAADVFDVEQARHRWRCVPWRAAK